MPTNPYLDYSGSLYDVVAIDMNTAARHNQQNETLRRILYALDKTVQTPDKNDPGVVYTNIGPYRNGYIQHRYNNQKSVARGAFNLDKCNFTNMNEQVFLVKNTAEFLDACFNRGGEAIGWRRIQCAPGVILKDIGPAIPSRTIIEGAVFEGDVDAGGIVVGYGGYAAAPLQYANGNIVFDPRDRRYSHKNFRIGDIAHFYSNSFTDAGHNYRVIEEIGNYLPDAGLEYIKINGSALTTAALGPVILLKRDIRFYNCIFYGEVIASLSQGHCFRNCRFVNDNAQTQFGHLIINGMLRTTVTGGPVYQAGIPVGGTHFCKVLNCEFIWNSDVVTAGVYILSVGRGSVDGGPTSTTTALVIKSCIFMGNRFYSNAGTLDLVPPIIGYPGDVSGHDGSILMGCEFGNANVGMQLVDANVGATGTAPDQNPTAAEPQACVFTLFGNVGARGSRQWNTVNNVAI